MVRPPAAAIHDFLHSRGQGDFCVGEIERDPVAGWKFALRKAIRHAAFGAKNRRRRLLAADLLLWTPESGSGGPDRGRTPYGGRKSPKAGSASPLVTCERVPAPCHASEGQRGTKEGLSGLYDQASGFCLFWVCLWSVHQGSDPGLGYPTLP